MDFHLSATGPFWAALPLAKLTQGEHYQLKLLRCPACEKRDVVPSMPAGWRDRMMLRRGRSPFECRVCGQRFYYFDPARAVAATDRLAAMKS